MRMLLVLGFALPLLGQVTHERILKAGSEPRNWLTYSGNYARHRFSPLNQIKDSNVAVLRGKKSGGDPDEHLLPNLQGAR